MTALVKTVSPFAVEHRRQLAEGVNQALNGKLNSTGLVTLTANAASTVVTDFRIGNDSVILLMPLTANAATALATTYILTTGIDPLNVQFTITHANNAQTDKSFRYVVLGSELS